MYRPSSVSELVANSLKGIVPTAIAEFVLDIKPVYLQVSRYI